MNPETTKPRCRLAPLLVKRPGKTGAWPRCWAQEKILRLSPRAASEILRMEKLPYKRFGHGSLPCVAQQKDKQGYSGNSSRVHRRKGSKYPIIIGFPNTYFNDEWYTKMPSTQVLGTWILSVQQKG